MSLEMSLTGAKDLILLVNDFFLKTLRSPVCILKLQNWLYFLLYNCPKEKNGCITCQSSLFVVFALVDVSSMSPQPPPLQTFLSFYSHLFIQGKSVSWFPSGVSSILSLNKVNIQSQKKNHYRLQNADKTTNTKKSRKITLLLTAWQPPSSFSFSCLHFEYLFFLVKYV